jgi:signal transduction histidine kinase
MKRRLTLVLALAVLTVMGILMFQLYWVYNSYRIERRNFDDKIATLLQSSLDAYAIQANALPSTLKQDSPYISVIESINKDSAGEASDTGRKTGYSLKFQPLQVAPENLQGVKGMIARLSMQAFNKPIQLSALDTIFRKELLKNGIGLAFTLVQKSPQEAPEAIFPGKRSFLFRQMVVPALVSGVLILLSVGSLLYMGYMIRRLVRLDATKNDFINNIAHELRTPISILKSTHEALYTFKADADPERLRRYLEINFGVLDRLDANVDRLLDIMQHEQGKRQPDLEPVDLTELIGDLIERLDKGGRGSVRLEPVAAPFEVLTDSYIIETILYNLIDNALKYSGPQPSVVVSLGRDAAGWWLRVRDGGKGIAAAHLPYIFDKFYRVPSGDLHEVKGYGIGLSYVAQLVTTLGGKISVKSVVDKGTEFVIEFPGNG